VSERAEDAPGPAPGPAREPHHQLPRQDAAAVRVREAPAGRRVGGDRRGRPHQRHPAAAHLVPAVPPVSALLHTAPGPVQGQDARVPGERLQARVAAQPRDPHQLQGVRQTVILQRLPPRRALISRVFENLGAFPMPRAHDRYLIYL